MEEMDQDPTGDREIMKKEHPFFYVAQELNMLGSKIVKDTMRRLGIR
jgi:hypothetical protein